jgi:ABC-type siderophore export system fused ATPase/permease subunit
MNIGAAFSALFAKAKEEIHKADLPHRNWSSLRWIGLLALVGLVVYNATSHLLSDTSLTLIAHCFVVWLVCNTVTRAVTTAANAWSRVRVIEALDKDGEVTEGEQKALVASEPKA